MTTIKLGSVILIDTLTENQVTATILTITEHWIKAVSNSGRDYLLSHRDAKIALKRYVESLPLLTDKII